MQQEARGVEDPAVAQPAQPADHRVRRAPRGDGRGVVERVQVVELGLVDGVAEPRQVVGDAAWSPLGVGPPVVLAPAALRGRRAGG